MANVPVHSSWHKEISTLSLFISLPQLITSPISVAISHLAYSHTNLSFELGEILDFLVISFPLTLSAAIIFVIIVRGNFNPLTFLLAVAGAALLSNLLHGLVSKFPFVGLGTAFEETYNKPGQSGSGSSSLFKVAFKIFGIYWKAYGPILFIQSCIIGIYAGVRYLNKQDKNKARDKIKKPA